MQRIVNAFEYAVDLHADQYRKGTRIPYLAHLMAVASLVMEDGGDEDEIIAALLHDAVEDQGGLKTLEEIEALFGKRVARIVDGCTDTYDFPKPPWRARKERYLAHLANADPDVRRVSLADKLHNARSILANLRQLGNSTFDRFTGGKDGTLWYYRSLVDVFTRLGRSPMIDELERVVAEIDQLVSQD
jgi:GTP pyrophosphokinase